MSAYGSLKTKKKSKSYLGKCPGPLTGMSAYENVKIQSLYGSKSGVSNKVAVSRVVHLRECPLRELRLYVPKSIFWHMSRGVITSHHVTITS